MPATKKDLKLLERSIRSIPGFPKPGIIFRDVTTLFKNAQALKKAADIIARECKNKKVDKVVAVEARGFVLGAIIAYKIGAGLVLVRKKGKLPCKTISASYELEYGTDTLYMHSDALLPGEKVMIVDDLLATGGTVSAVVKLVNKLKSRIMGISFLIELVDLKGRAKLAGYPVSSLVKFEGE
ncbi:MAG: adenine phosphoribosyltransferase [Candidatus Omnitrophica bacterium]|jgi:adenine phosphoribosyltransferase|nr:adenine phosphoribosyltransferase [Candidatus Omnitrophota bacterium]MDD5079002.1 adenine phosphoribosyltransferase [Candidatus Omnitrophota bacterium]